MNQNEIHKLTAGAPPPLRTAPFAIEASYSAKNTFLIWQNGTYTLRYNTGKDSFFFISGIDKAIEIKGPWQVRFPPNLGAPAEVVLPQLISWHRHPDEGVRFFSGTVTYLKSSSIPAKAITAGKRMFLDLGRVEHVAEVIVNNKNLGVL